MQKALVDDAGLAPILGVSYPGYPDGVLRHGLRNQTGHDVGLVPVRDSDHDLGRLQAGPPENGRAAPLPLNDLHIEYLLDAANTLLVEFDKDHVLVFRREFLRDVKPNLPGTYDDYTQWHTLTGGV
jgi:hypothetical protein